MVVSPFNKQTWHLRYFKSPGRKRFHDYVYVAFKEAIGKVEGLKRAHNDDTPLVAITMPPLQQPPKVQTLATVE